MSVETVLFAVLGGLAVASAVTVIAARNPVASALFLLVHLAALAGLFVLLDAAFVAVLQVIVYIGAILVLFLFVIMLLNLGHRYRPDLRPPRARWLAAALGLGLAVEIVLASRRLPGILGPGPEAVEAVVRTRGAVAAVGELLFSAYVVPFELTGVLLLVAMVGALWLAKRRPE